jgi:hypothetical protein
LQIPKDRLTNVCWQSITRQITDAAQSREATDLTIPFALARMMH